MNRGTFINLDAWCFWNTDDLGRMTEQGLKDDIDFYVAAERRRPLFNMNFHGRSSTPVRTPYAKDVELRDDGSLWLRGKHVVSPGPVIHDERTYARMFRALEEMSAQLPRLHARPTHHATPGSNTGTRCA